MCTSIISKRKGILQNSSDTSVESMNIPIAPMEKKTCSFYYYMYVTTVGKNNMQLYMYQQVIHWKYVHKLQNEVGNRQFQNNNDNLLHCI